MADAGLKAITAKTTTTLQPPLFEILGLIARSNWGTIWKTQGQNSQFRALKQITRNQDPPHPMGIDYRKVPDTEVEFLQRLNKEGLSWVPTLFHSWEIQTKEGHQCHYQLMELFDYDLLTYVKKWGHLWEDAFSKPFRLAFELGMKGIIHGDLQWNQFLLKVDAKDVIQKMAMSDFGFTSDVLDCGKSWFLEGWTVSKWQLGYFRYVQDAKDVMKRKLFAIYINIQQIVASILFWKMNVFLVRSDVPNTKECKENKDTNTGMTLCVVKSFSFGKYHSVMESMIAPAQRKSINTFYQTQMEASLTHLAKCYGHIKGVTIQYSHYDFSRLFSDEIKAFLEHELKLLTTTQALNKMVLDSSSSSGCSAVSVMKDD